MSDNTFWVLLWLGLAGAFAFTVVGMFAVDAWRDTVYIRAGYTRKMLPGDPYARWVRADEDTAKEQER